MRTERAALDGRRKKYLRSDETFGNVGMMMGILMMIRRVRRMGRKGDARMK